MRLVLVVLIQASVSAFVQLHNPRPPGTVRFPTCRRQALSLANSDTRSSDDAAITTSPERPIVVLGAGGKTGRIIVQILADHEHYVRAVVRSGPTKRTTSPTFLDEAYPERVSSSYVSYAVGDVTSFDSIWNVIQPEQGKAPAGVIWAVTSSGVKQGGGDVLEVDYRGAYNTAKACLACHVPPKLAFISAGCVTRPSSLGSRAVNAMAKLAFGDFPWVDAKMAGEAAVRDLYKQEGWNKRDETNAKPSYVIIRPTATLSNKPPIPVDELLVMQGDVYSSAEFLSRTNVANTVVSSLLKGTATDFTTLEVCPALRLYKNEEGNVFDLLGLPTWKQTTSPDLPKQLVHRNARSYEDLLDGLVTDEDMLKQYASIVNDYHVENLPVAEEFVSEVKPV